MLSERLSIGSSNRTSSHAKVILKLRTFGPGEGVTVWVEAGHQVPVQLLGEVGMGLSVLDQLPQQEHDVGRTDPVV